MELQSGAQPRTASAFDKVQERTPDPSPVRWGRAIALVIASGIGLWLAFSWIRGAPPAEESDLLLRMSTAASEFRAATPIRDGDEASAWVFDQYGWPIVIPDLPELQLVGAGETSLSDPESAPAIDATWVTPTFKYAGAGSETIVLYAYDYAQLDRASEWLVLPQGVFARLAEETPFDTRRLDATGDYAITWRRRAVVFTAITESEAVVERLTEVLSVPVRL
ncbi:MAG: hypothetical protein Rubg2KO_15900 [Rubricoccaceae bacterium]